MDGIAESFGHLGTFRVTEIHVDDEQSPATDVEADGEHLAPGAIPSKDLDLRHAFTRENRHPPLDRAILRPPGGENSRGKA
eukprot:5952614-Alexandrium_andersonii.AAC.1